MSDFDPVRSFIVLGIGKTDNFTNYDHIIDNGHSIKKILALFKKYMKV